MEIVKREENTYPWYEPILTPLLELGYGFTVTVISAAIALCCSVFWLLPEKCRNDFFLAYLVLDFIVLIGLGLLQLIAFAACVIDLSRRQTYQNWIRVVLAISSLILNGLPSAIYWIVTGALENGFV